MNILKLKAILITRFQGLKMQKLYKKYQQLAASTD